ncbi:hypothetical protein VNI00_004016 [Paramarasmius palmivorus]|uniref:Uncharacterized protein n=1 Tax=Paramarasmius palmivorus TaxID=297713 RepID=A0AAW0DNF3_9AGAR
MLEAVKTGHQPRRMKEAGYPPLECTDLAKAEKLGEKICEVNKRYQILGKGGLRKSRSPQLEFNHPRVATCHQEQERLWSTYLELFNEAGPMVTGEHDAVHFDFMKSIANGSIPQPVYLSQALEWNDMEAHTRCDEIIAQMKLAEKKMKAALTTARKEYRKVKQDVPGDKPECRGEQSGGDSDVAGEGDAGDYVGPSLLPQQQDANQLSRRRIHISSVIVSNFLAQQIQENESTTSQETLAIQAQANFNAQIDQFLANDVTSSESPGNRKARLRIEGDWRIFLIGRAEELRRESAALGITLSSSINDLSDETGLLDIWRPDVVKEFAPRFMPWRLGIAKIRPGRTCIKSRTLLSLLTLFVTCIVRYSRTTQSPRAGALILTDGGLYMSLKDITVSLIRKHQLDRYTDPPKFYDKWEVQLMVNAGLTDSENREFMRIHNVGKCTLSLTTFFIGTRPGSIGPSELEYLTQGQYMRVEHIRIFKLGDSKFKIVLYITNYKGNNQAKGISQRYELESVQLPHNISLCLVMYYIAHMFMQGYLHPKYKNIQDVLQETHSEIARNEACLNCPLFPKPTNPKLPMSSQAISKAMSDLAYKAGLPGGGAYSLRHGAGNEYEDILGKQGARMMLNHISNDTFYSHYSKTVGNYNLTHLRLGEVKAPMSHFVSRPQQDQTRAAVFAILSRQQQMPDKDRLTPGEMQEAEERKRLDEIWERYLPLFGESKAYYLSKSRTLQTAKQLMEEALKGKEGEASAKLIAAGYDPISCSDIKRATEILAEMENLCGVIKNLVSSNSGTKWQAVNHHQHRDRQQMVLRQEQVQKQRQFVKDDVRVQSHMQDESRLWESFIVHFNEVHKAYQGARGMKLANKLVEHAGHIDLQLVRIQRQYAKGESPGLQWASEGSEAKAREILTELQIFYDVKKSLENKARGSFRTTTHHDVQQQYNKGLVVTHTQVQETLKELERPDPLAINMGFQAKENSAASTSEHVEAVDFDDDLVEDCNTEGSAVHKDINLLLRSHGLPTAFAAYKEEVRDDDEIIVEGEMNLSTLETVEKQFVGRYLPEFNSISIGDVQREFLHYLLTPFLFNKALDESQIVPGTWKCPLCPRVPWHTAPIPTYSSRAGLKAHITIQHSEWHQLEIEIEYEKDRFRCPSGDYHGISLQAVRLHMISKSCKDSHKWMTIKNYNSSTTLHPGAQHEGDSKIEKDREVDSSIETEDDVIETLNETEKEEAARAAVEEVWTRFLPLFNDSKEHYMNRMPMNRQLASLLLQECQRQTASKSLIRLGYPKLVCHNLEAAQSVSSNLLTYQELMDKFDDLDTIRRLWERYHYKDITQDDYNTLVDKRTMYDEVYANDVKVVQSQAALDESWTRFLSLFNDAAKDYPGKRRVSLARLLHDLANKSKKPKKTFRHKHPEGIRWKRPFEESEYSKALEQIQSAQHDLERARNAVRQRLNKSIVWTEKYSSMESDDEDGDLDADSDEQSDEPDLDGKSSEATTAAHLLEDVVALSMSIL